MPWISGRIISFGYGHAEAPEADLTVDVRRVLHDPHIDPAMRQMTGLDEIVRAHVMTTPGAARLARTVVETVKVLVLDCANPKLQMIQVGIGCAGGRHRSVALAAAVGELLRQIDINMDVEHRDVARPVLTR
jgi:RNase adaptor protein for sRNA GlmZ degradation